MVSITGKYNFPLNAISVTGARGWTVDGYHGYLLATGDRRVPRGGIEAPKPNLITADEFKKHFIVNKKSFGGILTVVFYVEKKSCVRKECYDEVMFLT